MKTIFLFLCIILFTEISSAQYVGYFSVGYNASFVNPSGLNEVIGKYNAARPWLSEPMKNIKYMGGTYWGFSGIFRYIMLDFSYCRRSAMTSAQGDNGAGMMQRDLKTAAHTFNIGMGLNFTEDPPYIGAGYNIDLGANSTKTRIGALADIDKMDFEKLEAPLFVGSSFWAQIFLTGSSSSGVGLILRPYYHFDFLKTNYTYINEDLTPLNDPYNTTEIRGKLNHFGVNLTLALKIGD